VARTVKVILDAEEQPYVASMGRAERATGKYGDAVDKVGDQAKETAAATGKAKDQVDDLGEKAKGTGAKLTGAAKDAAKLDYEIRRLEGSVRDLAREFARTGDVELFGDIRKQQAELRKHLNVRKLMGDVAEDGASGFSVAFFQKLGPLMARMPVGALSPAAAAIGGGLAAGVATVLTTAVAGAIIGGSAGAGIVGGLIAASRDQAVQAAAAELGDTALAMFEESFASFGPVTVEALAIVRRQLLGMEGDLDRLGAATSRFVAPLTEGIGTGVTDIFGEIVDLAERADPVIAALGDSFVNLGDAVADGLDLLEDNANEAGRALTLLLTVVEGLVRGVFHFINAASEAYGWMESIGGILRGDLSPAIRNLYEDEYEVASATEEHNRKLQEQALQMEAVRDASVQYADALDRIKDQNLTAAEATLRYKDALDEAKDALDKKTAVSREEDAALIDLAQSSNNLTNALDDQGRSASEAAAHHKRLRQDFIRAAEAAGYSKKEAAALADQYLKIPRNVRTNVQAETDAARREIAAYKAQLASIARTITTRFNVDARGNATVFKGQRWGGITEHAQDGLLRQAGIYTAQSPARYAFAEPATGGEFFGPKYGNLARTRSLAEYAVENWWGGSVQWRGQPGGGASGGSSSTAVTNNYYWQPQRADASMRDFEAFQHRQDVLSRLGRAG
jgi:hypothetical protein